MNGTIVPSTLTPSWSTAHNGHWVFLSRCNGIRLFSYWHETEDIRANSNIGKWTGVCQHTSDGNLHRAHDATQQLRIRANSSLSIC